MNAQLELAIPASDARGYQPGDRVLLCHTLDGQALASDAAAPIGTVLARGSIGRGINETRNYRVVWDGEDPDPSGHTEAYLRPAGGRVTSEQLEELRANVAAWQARPHEWWCGPYPDANAEHVVRSSFTHMIRSAGDPERSSREAWRAKYGPEFSTKVVRDRAKRDPKAWLADAMALLADGKPRTFNAITVETLDITADIAGRALWHAIVDAVIAGQLEHTYRAPVLIRLRQPEEVSAPPPSGVV